MKSELFLMRTVKSRALLRLNETFYFLLCRVIASFKSSSTTCQARSCMIINTLRKYCFFFATIFNDIQNFWITVKVIKFNVKRNYPYHFIFAAITCKKTKKKIRSMHMLRMQFETSQTIRILSNSTNSLHVSNSFIMWSIYADSITQFPFNVQIFHISSSIFNSISITLLRLSGITLSLNFFQRSVVNQK